MKRLNLGCGCDIKEGYDNVDIQRGEGIFKSFDFDKFPYPIDDDTYDDVYCWSVFEHLCFPDRVLNELWRICSNGAKILIVTGHYTNKGAYESLEHRTYFSQKAFEHHVENTWMKDKKPKFKIIKLEVEPTSVGKWIPKYIREKLAMFMGGLLSRIFVEIEVVK